MLNNVVSENEFEAVRRYYRTPAVRQRVKEFCGGDPFTCEYLVGAGESLLRRGYQRPLRVAERDGLIGLMEDGLDIFRSVWDEKATLAVWDVEYFNLDTWADLYRDQVKYFALMEPAYRVIERLFNRYDIPHLNDTTASGYHFISRVPFSSPVHARLEKIGPLEKSLAEKYALVPGGDNKRKRPVPERDGKGYSAIGRLMEFLSHQVIRETRAESPLAITISDTARGRTVRGREGMNLDITQYGDPLFMRTIRMSFSTHQKHKIYVEKVGVETARGLPFFATVPRNSLSYEELYEIRRHLTTAADYAAGVCSEIPDAAIGWGKVLDDYLVSPLFAFHHDFDAMESEPPARWPETYWRLDLNALPHCVANALRNPTWGLTVPTSLQLICRYFMSRGWHPKHVGGLIRSHYEQNRGWAIDWNKYHPETRANFWARIYCGLIATGVDTLEDLNCISHAEKGFCPAPWCGYNLNDCREALLKK
ncbi:MAG: hypothetical protein NTV79_10655 [Candidatus Aureabacteria bacterium]|nr:hypothetical protein [Candidatus Auribacterota bacterium]